MSFDNRLACGEHENVDRERIVDIGEDTPS